MSNLASIKVPLEVRDRFSIVAQARNMTVRALLDEVSRHMEDVVAMEEVAREMAQMRDKNPGEWRAYLEEGQAWEQGTIERLDT